MCKMTPMPHSCGGFWEALPRWGGRYRCSECGAIGYRGLAARSSRAKRDAITEYSCSKSVKIDGKRKRCPEHAVAKNARKAWVCVEHRTPATDIEADDDGSQLLACS